MTNEEVNIRLIISKYFDAGKHKLNNCYIVFKQGKVLLSRCNLFIGDSKTLNSFRLMYKNEFVYLTNIRLNSLVEGDISNFYRLIFNCYFMFSELNVKLNIWKDSFPKDLLKYEYLKRLDIESLVNIYVYIKYKVPLPHYYEQKLFNSYFVKYVKDNHNLQPKEFYVAVYCYLYCQDYLIAYLFPDLCKGMKSLLSSLQKNNKWSLGELNYASTLLNVLSKEQIETALYLNILKQCPNMPEDTLNLVGKFQFSQSRYGLTKEQHTRIYVDRAEPIKKISLFSLYKETIYDYLNTNGMSIPIFYFSKELRAFKSEKIKDISSYSSGVIMPDIIVDNVNVELKKLEKDKVLVEDSIHKVNNKKEVYDKLKQDQIYLAAKINKIKEILKNRKHKKYNSARVGALVEVISLSKNMTVNTYLLVDRDGGSDNRVSQETPFFKAIKGKKTNQIFKVIGPHNNVYYYKILSIR